MRGFEPKSLSIAHFGFRKDKQGAIDIHSASWGKNVFTLMLGCLHCKLLDAKFEMRLFVSFVRKDEKVNDFAYHSCTIHRMR